MIYIPPLDGDQPLISAQSLRSRRIVGRLDRGGDLLKGILDLCARAQVRSGEIRATGYLARNWFLFNRHQWMDETVGAAGELTLFSRHAEVTVAQAQVHSRVAGHGADEGQAVRR